MRKGIKFAEGQSFFSLLLSVLMITFFASTGASAQQPAAEPDPWQFGVSIYGWLPDISGQTVFSRDGGGDFEIEIDNILDNLEFTLMGTFDARKGRWGLLTDVIYMSVGNSKDGVREASIGSNQIPVNAAANVHLDLKSWVCAFTGYYRALDQNGHTLDVVVGTRYLDVEQDVNWSITGNVNSIPIEDRTGSVTADLNNWDAVMGIRGKFGFGATKAWFIPYYLDGGLGQSDWTWQGALGLGYAFTWGEIAGVWRYLSYDLGSDSAIADMNFSGPAAGVILRF